MRFNKFSHIIAAFAAICAVSGCGTRPPQIQEAWEGRDIDGHMGYRIKKKIFCELVDALIYVGKEVKFGQKPALPLDYSVQMAITLTIEESTGFNPTVTYNNVFPNGIDSGLPVGQMLNVGAGGNLSSAATRVDTSYTYFVVGRIADAYNQQQCHNIPANTNGSSLLLQSDLGIRDYLVEALIGADTIHSSPNPKDSIKADVYSYEIKFVVVSNGNINPTWKLVRVSGGGGLPFLTTGRTRTHDLILTFGPTGKSGLAPSDSSLNQQFIRQQGEAFSRGTQIRP